MAQTREINVETQFGRFISFICFSIIPSISIKIFTLPYIDQSGSRMQLLIIVLFGYNMDDEG